MQQPLFPSSQYFSSPPLVPPHTQLPSSIIPFSPAYRQPVLYWKGPVSGVCWHPSVRTAWPLWRCQTITSQIRRKKAVLSVSCAIRSKNSLCVILFPMKLHCYASQIKRYMKHFSTMIPEFGEKAPTIFWISMTIAILKRLPKFSFCLTSTTTSAILSTVIRFR